MQVKELVTEILKEYDIGLTLVDVKIQDAEPPTQEVIEAFKAVETAKQQAETVLNDAKAYQNAELPKAQAEAAAKEAAETKERLLRTAAEYENFRKRSAREADQKFNDGVSFAVEQIIPILDTLEMAANAPCGDENYKKGVTMTLDKAVQALAKLNISEVEALGKPFDPNTMHAVQQVPAGEGQESGTVSLVFQKGYLLGEKLVRPATVVVFE